jgi:oxygen-independent coproporphyrinogen III oxidase
MTRLQTVDPLLIRKYNQPLPRYTSYPTVPFWNEGLDAAAWKELFAKQFETENGKAGISLYIHLPFCESLCTYCGCNKKITTNHNVEDEYLSAIEAEWNLYRQLMTEPPIIRELHLGGGTPTFFAPENLQRLIQTILRSAQLHPDYQFSIEGHPNNTTRKHLEVLYNLGFRRISYGVQDNDPTVQRVINRIQPVENVRRATKTAREIGFTSVNYDLIYGLPLQTLSSIERTIKEVIKLKPDRIAFYSYAHVPWTSKAQRLFDEADLPDAETKINLYLKGKELLTAAGYADIGMDHFALPHDELFLARKAGTLHRNFMGYTTQHTGLLLGLGVSAISDTGTAFAQNEKTLHNYYEAVRGGNLAISKGYILSEKDKAFKKYILDISCNGATTFKEDHRELLEAYTFPKLEVLAKDGLIEWNAAGLKLTTQGHYFIRVVCSAFDLYLQRSTQRTKPIFSKSI